MGHHDLRLHGKSGVLAGTSVKHGADRGASVDTTAESNADHGASAGITTERSATTGTYADRGTDRGTSVGNKSNHDRHRSATWLKPRGVRPTAFPEIAASSANPTTSLAMLTTARPSSTLTTEPRR